MGGRVRTPRHPAPIGAGVCAAVTAVSGCGGRFNHLADIADRVKLTIDTGTPPRSADAPAGPDQVHLAFAPDDTLAASVDDVFTTSNCPALTLEATYAGASRAHDTASRCRRGR